MFHNFIRSINNLRFSCYRNKRNTRIYTSVHICYTFLGRRYFSWNKTKSGAWTKSIQRTISNPRLY